MERIVGQQWIGLGTPASILIRSDICMHAATQLLLVAACEWWWHEKLGGRMHPIVFPRPYFVECKFYSLECKFPVSPGKYATSACRQAEHPSCEKLMPASTQPRSLRAQAKAQAKAQLAGSATVHAVVCINLCTCVIACLLA